MFVAMMLALAVVAAWFLSSRLSKRVKSERLLQLPAATPDQSETQIEEMAPSQLLPTQVDKRVRFGWQHELDELFVSTDDGSILGLNFADRKLFFGTLDRHKCYRFADIVGVELHRNGAILTETNRGSQLAGAAIGGLAFGGVGALAGALTGSTRSGERLSDLLIAVTVDDWEQPLQKITFVRATGAKGLDPRSPDVARMLTVAEKAYAHLELAIKASQAVAAIDATTGPVLNSGSGPSHLVQVVDWGKMTGPLLGIAFQTARPELTTKEAMITGLQSWKRAPMSLTTASAGECRRLRSALIDGGASIATP